MMRKIILLCCLLPALAHAGEMGRNEQQLKEQLWGKEHVYREVDPQYRNHMGRNEMKQRRELFGEQNIIRELEKRRERRQHDDWRSD